MKKFTFFICFAITLVSCEKYDSKNSDIAETGEVVELGAFSARIQGICRQKPEKALSVIYGIEYSENDLNTNPTDVEATQISSDGNFDVCIDELTANTLYYYCFEQPNVRTIFCSKIAKINLQAQLIDNFLRF